MGKFKRGNIVRYKIGFHGNITDCLVGKLGIIEYSYNSKYHSGKDDIYSVVEKDTGNSSSWWKEEYLEFVNEGSEEEIEEAYKVKEKREKYQKDLHYIKEIILLNPTKITSVSVVYLFDRIGFESYFQINGEFFTLFHDWEKLYPIFYHLFKGEYDSMLECADKILIGDTKSIIIENLKQLYHEVEELDKKEE